MGLTNSSVGKGAVDAEIVIKKGCEDERIIALAGNPNVGKSTVFNGLTGMNQHTGNWPGKTVANAQGRCKSKKNSYIMVDIPGTYSLMAHSAEEEVARNFICFSQPDAVVVVCDATCIERNMNLVLQVLEISSKVVLCVNLLDEAKKKGINVNLAELSKRLGIPVVGVVARKKKSLSALLDTLDNALESENKKSVYSVKYSSETENAIDLLSNALECAGVEALKINPRWLALRLIDSDRTLEEEIRFICSSKNINILDNENVIKTLENVRQNFREKALNEEDIEDGIACSLMRSAEQICRGIITYKKTEYGAIDRKIDRILTGKVSAYPIMLALLALIFWITISAANYPSQLLSALLFTVQDWLSELFYVLGSPDWLHGAIVLGAYRVLAWVVSVMLPPMAIFFPLFTLLEDLGYLPRIAYNLDKPLKKCNACGKQALTMC